MRAPTMKITKQHLKQIIQEEIDQNLADQKATLDKDIAGEISPAGAAGRSEELKNRAIDFMEQVFAQMGNLEKELQLDITIDWSKIKVDPSGHPSQKGNVITVPMNIVNVD